MGFCYRKSVTFGPFRVDAGRGVGDSVGGREFFTGVSSCSLPGAALGYRTGGRRCLVMLAGVLGVGTPAAHLLSTLLAEAL